MKTKPIRKKLTTESITNAVLGLGASFGKTITPEVFHLWGLILEDLYEDEFWSAIKEYMIGPSGNFWPQPGQIFALARPRPDKDHEAQLMVERLFDVLGTCGDDKEGIARAQSKLPPVVWGYVLNVGGWAKFSREMQTTEGVSMTTLKAQIRNGIVGVMERQEQGKSLVVGPNDGLLPIADFAKKLLPAMPKIKLEDTQQENDDVFS